VDLLAVHGGCLFDPALEYPSHEDSIVVDQMQGETVSDRVQLEEMHFVLESGVLYDIMNGVGVEGDGRGLLRSGQQLQEGVHVDVANVTVSEGMAEVQLLETVCKREVVCLQEEGSVCHLNCPPLAVWQEVER